MDHTVQLYAGCAGITIAMIASATWWQIRARARAKAELLRMERSVPISRDGLLLSALVIDIVKSDGPVMSNDPWLGDLWVVIDSVVERSKLKKVGTYLNTYMVAAPDFRIAQEALMQTAVAALDIRDAINLFVMERKLAVRARFGINADIIPTVGLGSTVALSHLWNTAMNLAEHAQDNNIELSDLAAEWLGPTFDIERFGDRPVLHTRKSA
jgi:Adenylate and Guanylate cyclase catalytic domain